MNAQRLPLVIVPAYNEQASIGGVVAELRRHAPGTDVIVVNDHSTDRTGEILDELDQRQLRLPCNLGYRNAVKIGCVWALANGYRRAVFFDGDGQHPAEEVLPMLERLALEDADVVLASRYSARGTPAARGVRYRGNQLFCRVVRLLSGLRVTDSTSGMKAVGPRVLPIIAEGDFLDLHAEVLAYLGLRGFRIVEHPARFAERRTGVSMYRWFDAVRYPLLTGTLLLCSIVRAWLDRRAGTHR